MPYNWRKADAWRAHPLISNNVSKALPGLGIATGAFVLYVAYTEITGTGPRHQRQHH